MRRFIPVLGPVVGYPAPVGMDIIHSLLKADTVDSFVLLDRKHVCIVDDAGHGKHLPINPVATSMYWVKCGGPNTHMIRGDVFVCPDSDFAP